MGCYPRRARGADTGEEGRGQERRSTATEREAERWFSLVEAGLLRGEWLDPSKSDVRLIDYAEKWIDERAGLRPRTVELYRRLLTKHMAPRLGRVPLDKMTPSSSGSGGPSFWRPASRPP